MPQKIVQSDYAGAVARHRSARNRDEGRGTPHQPAAQQYLQAAVSTDGIFAPTKTTNGARLTRRLCALLAERSTVYGKAIGPRLGFAYSVNSKTVLRGGYGIFYEPLKEGSFADQDSLGFFNRQTVNVTNGGPTQIDNGVTRIFPDSGPFTPEAQNGSNGVIYVAANSGRPADIQTWNLDVQRQLMSNLALSVAYVGSKGTHLPALDIIPNQVNPSFLSLGSELTMNATCLSNNGCPKAIALGVQLPYPTFSGNINQLLRPFPQYGDFNQEDNSFTPDRTGNSTYHAMQLQLNKRFAQGLSFLVSYTVSKNITDADSAGPGVSGFIGTNSFIGQNSYDRKAEKAVSQLDTPQSLVASFFYELPVGHGKRYLNAGGAMDRVVGGWYVSGIASYKSGTPTTVYGPCGGTAGDVLFAGCHLTGLARVNVISGVNETNKSNFRTPDMGGRKPVRFLGFRARLRPRNASPIPCRGTWCESRSSPRKAFRGLAIDAAN